MSVAFPTRPLSDLGWMSLRSEVLFTQDDEGRLLETREPHAAVAPRFYLGRSLHGNVWRFRADLDSESVRDLARLAAREAPLAAGGLPPERIQAFRDVLTRRAPVRAEYRGPAFRFPVALLSTPGGDIPWDGMLEIDASTRERLREDFVEWMEEIPQRCPCVVVEEAGRVVSLCCNARALGGRGAEAGVETLEASRGRGHAVRVVLGWARAAAANGLHPFYSTSWDNVASRGVARRLGLIQVGEDLHFS
jgi:hypothetical protein